MRTLFIHTALVHICWQGGRSICHCYGWIINCPYSHKSHLQTFVGRQTEISHYWCGIFGSTLMHSIPTHLPAKKQSVVTVASMGRQPQFSGTTSSDVAWPTYKTVLVLTCSAHRCPPFSRYSSLINGLINQNGRQAQFSSIASRDSYLLRNRALLFPW